MITNTENRIGFSANGVTTVFQVPFRFINNADLTVIHQVAGEDIVKTEGTDYSVAGANDEDGGTVTFSVPPSTGTLWIVRDTPARQEVDLEAKDNFRAETTEEALDRLTILVQELRRKVKHAIHVPITEIELDLGNLELPFYIDRASTLLGFDGEGQLKLYNLDIDTLLIDLSDVIPDGSITANMLAVTLDLSSKTIVLPANSITGANFNSLVDLHDKTVIFPVEGVNDPVCIPNSISSGSLNPTLRLRKVAINQTTEPSILVEGAGVANANGVYVRSGTAFGHPTYINANNYYFSVNDADQLKWILYNDSDVAVYESYHFFIDPALTPVEPTPDQMPIPWYVAGTAGTEPAMRVTVDLADLAVNGAVSATTFIGDGSQLTGISGGSSTSSVANYTLKNFPTNGTKARRYGNASTGGDGGIFFEDSNGHIRLIGRNNTASSSFSPGSATQINPSLRRKLDLSKGTLSTVTHTCDNAGTSIAAIELGAVSKIMQCGSVAMVLTTTGLLFAIGEGGQGALGQGDLADQSGFVGIKVGGTALKTNFITDFTMTPVQPTVAGLGVTVAAIDIDGKVWTWGENSNGQLGATVGDKSTPYNDATWAFNALVAKQVVTAGCCTWVLTTSGAIYGSGQNSYGQLGVSGDTSQKTTFTLATNTGTTIIADSIYAVGVRETTNCRTSLYALTAAGALYSTGFNGTGQLGLNNSLANVSVLTAVHASIGTIAKLYVMGGFNGVCWCYAVKSNGAIIAWGANGSSGGSNGGQLGIGTRVNSETGVTPTGLAALLGNPTSDSGIADIVGIVHGASNEIANVIVLGANGVLAVTGNNSAGQIGNGTITNSLVFVAMSTLTTPSKIWGVPASGSAGSNVIYYLDTGNVLWACGANTYQQISLAASTMIFDTPIPVRV